MIDRSNDLFGEPPLMKGEDKDRYLRLRAEVAESLEPKTIIDWMIVNDVTNKYWEELRLKRNATDLIESTSIEALASLLAPYIPPMASMKLRSPREIARLYYSGDAKSRKQMASLLEQYGITADQIQAKAVQLSGNGLQMIDRMGANRESSRRSLRKENERPFGGQDSPPDNAEKRSKQSS